MLHSSRCLTQGCDEKLGRKEEGAEDGLGRVGSGLKSLSRCHFHGDAAGPNKTSISERKEEAVF